MTLRLPSRFAHLLLFVTLLAQPLASVADDEPGDSAADHVMQAEVALHGGDYLKAVTEYVRAAELSDSVEIASQATLLAFDYDFEELSETAAARWLELAPDSDEALARLAQVQLRRGDLRSARRSYEKLIERGDGPADERLYVLLGFVSQEDPHDADQLMRALAKPYKDSALAQYATAAAAIQADDVDYAMAKARLAIELRPDWLKPKLLYARAMLLSGKVDEAIDYTARLIGDDPDPDPDARMELALLYMSAGREEDALSQVNQVLLERSSRTDALRMMAIINFRQNNLDAAWDDFEDLLASGDYADDALFYLARIADFRGETDRAIRLYSQVKNGANAVQSQRRAAALLAYQKDELESALRHVDEFAEERRAFAIDMLLVKAGLLSQSDRRQEALELMDRVVSYRPDNEAVALSRGELMLQMGQLEGAIAAYRAAARRWPDSAMTLNALGYTLADRTGEYREAEKLIRRALKHDPDNPAIIDSMGWVLFRQGEYEKALGYLETAYNKFPDHEVAAHVVETLDALNRRDEALQFLRQAEEQTPGSALLEDVRERLFPESR